MLAIERHNHITHILERCGTIRTTEVAKDLGVTDETIRRDLKILEKGDQLLRIHGGASSISGRPKLQSFSERSALNTEYKLAIAKATVSTVTAGRTYAFDSSTTALALVSLLHNLPYRVITNSLAVLQSLVNYDKIELIATGGSFHKKTNTFIGGDSINTLNHHRIHTAYISCIGFDLNRGASEGFEQQATYKERLVQLADEVVLLIDSSKINAHSEYYFASSDQITQVITDNRIKSETANAIRANGMNLVIAKP